MTRTLEVPLAVQLLDGKKHDRSAFFCGVPALDQYLKVRASQEAARGTTSVHVATPDGTTIAGFYTLSQYAIQPAFLPDAFARKMPAYDLVGACLIGRLATSLGFRGQGVGEFLLMNAIQRFVGIAPEIAAPIMVVDAKDQNAVLFYEKFGFVQFPTVKGRLFLPLKTAQAMAVAMR